MKKNTVFALVALAAFALPVSAVRAQDVKVQNPQSGTTTEVTNLPDGSTVINVTVNNEAVTFDKSTRPIMMGGRILVPLRGVVERLGGTIQYDAQSQVITGGQANLEKQFRLRVGSGEALVNGKNQTLDSPPRVVNGVTYVPLRFVSEALGADVRWDADKHTVTIMADGHTADVKPRP